MFNIEKSCTNSKNEEITSMKSKLDDEKNEEFHHREGGCRGWVVVVASGYCFGILIGMVSSYALIYNGLEKEYNQTSNPVFYIGMSHFYFS
jgi:hypothetical protein